MRSSFQRVYVPLHCSRCGKEEFEGVAFGQERIRRLRAQTDTREIVCDKCLKAPADYANLIMKRLGFPPIEVTE